MNQQQMVTGTPCKPEPIIPKKEILYLECQWKPQIGIIIELKLSSYKINEFWHKVHNRSDLYCNPRATEEPRAGLKHGCLNSQSELREQFVMNLC